MKLFLTNRSETFRHDIAVKGDGIRVHKGKIVGKGGVSTVTIRLAPGRYTYSCSKGTARRSGRYGTLTVP